MLFVHDSWRQHLIRKEDFISVYSPSDGKSVWAWRCTSLCQHADIPCWNLSNANQVRWLFYIQCKTEPYFQYMVIIIIDSLSRHYAWFNVTSDLAKFRSLWHSVRSDKLKFCVWPNSSLSDPMIFLQKSILYQNWLNKGYF